MRHVLPSLALLSTQSSRIIVNRLPPVVRTVPQRCAALRPGALHDRQYHDRRARLDTRRYRAAAVSSPGMSDMDGNEGELRNKTQQSPLARQRAKESGESKGGRFSNLFPLGYKDTFSQWWANVPAAVAEHDVLSFIPYLQSPPTQTQTGREVRKEQPDGTVATSSDTNLAKTDSQTATSANDPYGPRVWHSNLVRLPGRNRALNEFSVEREGEPTENNLVVVHGYGAGLGFFYKNFEALSRPKGWRLYALDLLGMGRSSRPPFKIKAKDREGAVREAEDWFVDSLEEWRRERNIDRFTLMGHSLGGYMAVAYALKYPGHLNKLILASPVGIPEDPYAVQADLPEPDVSAVEAEFQETGSGSGASTPVRRAGDNNNFMNQSKKRADDAGEAQPRRRPLSKWITYLWDANISPFSLVRWSGPLGPRFVSGWTTRRFGHLAAAEAEALHTYAYTLFKQKGSGEYSLAYVLAPGAFARSPLIRRIGSVGRQPIPATPPPIVPSESGCWPLASSATSQAASTASVGSTATPAPPLQIERGLPVIFFYGEHDWMDVAGGYDAAEKLKTATRKALSEATKEEKAEDQGVTRVHIVQKAGHHVYLDGWEEFNKVMLEEMKDVEDRERRRKARLEQ